MQFQFEHAWDTTIDQAKEIQNNLSQKILIRKLPSGIHKVAGVDVSYIKEKNKLIAGMVVFDYPSLNIIDTVFNIEPIKFPYIPGYLSFREAPSILNLIRNYRGNPDLYIFDGHGIAHPRGLGIASHVGVICDKPSIGCAKKNLCGTYQSPGENKGAYADIVYKENRIGKAVRTRTSVKPVFISVGNRTSLDGAVDFVLSCCRGYRLPEPTRHAHLQVSAFKKTVH